MRRNRSRPEESRDPYGHALRLLARREHSRAELRRKLIHKGFEADAVDTCLDRLSVERLQSDARFVETFVRHRVQQGYGPHRISGELRERGIEGEDADTGLDEAAADWSELARETLHRRFGDGPPLDAREWAKRARYLQYRGFPSDLVRRVLKQSKE